MKCPEKSEQNRLFEKEVDVNINDVVILPQTLFRERKARN